MALKRSQAGAPELYRQLITGELCFLLPYHPEMVEGGRMAVQNGSPFPFCVQTEPDGNEVVPIFSSDARLEESLRVGDTPPNKFLCGAMPAVQVLEIIGKCGFAAVPRARSPCRPSCCATLRTAPFSNQPDRVGQYAQP